MGVGRTAVPMKNILIKTKISAKPHVKTGSRRGGKMKSDHIERLQYYVDSGAHLLIPTPNINDIPPMHKVSFDELWISRKPEDKEIYKGSSKGWKGDKVQLWRLSGTALEKLAVCAAITWHTTESKVISINSDYACYQAVGGIRKTDNSIPYVKGSADIDLKIILDDLEKQYLSPKAESYWLKGKYNKNKTSQDYQSYAKECIERDYQQKRRFKLELVETAARLRVIRKLLPLKAEYSLEELEKPFVAVSVVFVADMNDPIVKRLFINNYMGATTGLYGLPSPDTVSIPQNTPPNIYNKEADPNPEPAIDIQASQASPEQNISAEEIVEILLDEFEAMSREERVVAVKQLAKDIKYEKEFRQPVEQWKDAHMSAFFADNIAKKEQ